MTSCNTCIFPGLLLSRRVLILASGVIFKFQVLFPVLVPLLSLSKSGARGGHREEAALKVGVWQDNGERDWEACGKGNINKRVLETQKCFHIRNSQKQETTQWVEIIFITLWRFRLNIRSQKTKIFMKLRISCFLREIKNEIFLLENFEISKDTWR